MPPDYWQRPCAPWIAKQKAPAPGLQACKDHSAQNIGYSRKCSPFMGLGEARTALECAPTLSRVLPRAAPQKKKFKQQQLGGEAPIGPLQKGQSRPSS
jgi:hypothetical protein